MSTESANFSYLLSLLYTSANSPQSQPVSNPPPPLGPWRVTNPLGSSGGTTGSPVARDGSSRRPGHYHQEMRNLAYRDLLPWWGIKQFLSSRNLCLCKCMGQGACSFDWVLLILSFSLFSLSLGSLVHLLFLSHCLVFAQFHCLLHSRWWCWSLYSIHIYLQSELFSLLK